MTITRIQALIIAAGLALVGVAVARAGHDTPTGRVRILGEGSIAQSYPLRDNRLRGDLPLEAPPGLRPGQPFSRL